MNCPDIEFDPAFCDPAFCDGEPPHAVGSIQPHGVVLVVDEAYGIVQLGGDTDRLFGRGSGELLGKPLAVALDLDAGRWFVSGPQDVPARPGWVGTWPAPMPGQPAWDVTGHRSGQAVVLEFEPSPVPWRNPTEAVACLSSAIAALDTQTGVAALCSTASAQIRRLTGFDQVTVHRFPDEGRDGIVAGNAAGTAPSSARHRFATTDLPAPSASPFLHDRIRLVADTGQLPAPLVTAPDASPIDLGACILRGVPPDHLRGLRNRGVAASLSLLVMVDGLPWGWIACHHHEPRLVPYAVRETCMRVAEHLAQQVHLHGQAARQPSPDDGEAHRLRRALSEQRSLLVRNRLLMQETHHRVQNNLHIIASLLRMQARQATDPQVRAPLDAATGRLMAVGAVHRYLAAPGDTLSVQLLHHLEQLCADLALSWGEEWARHITVAGDEVTMAGDMVVTLSLMVTELLTNAVKYAYDGAPGPIAVSVEKTGSILRLGVRDQGRGMDGKVAGGGLGSRLIRMFTRQLDARIETHSGEDGTAVTIDIPYAADGCADQTD